MRTVNECEICKVTDGHHLTGCQNEKTGEFSGTLDALVGLRPTDEEIELEARQWAQEHGTYGELHKTSWILGARWARGVAQYSKKPANACSEPELKQPKETR